MVGLQTLDLAIGVRVPASQPINLQLFPRSPAFKDLPPLWQRLQREVRHFLTGRRGLESAI